MLPYQGDLVANLRQLANASEPLTRCLKALETGVFIDREAQIDELGETGLTLGSAALLAYLSPIFPLPLSIEVGFGMGSSAAVTLSVHSLAASPFENIVYDPWGPPDGRGQVVQAYLDSYFGSQFRLRRKLSQVGLAQLFDERGPRTVGLAFIDGGHRYEDVMADFMLASVLCWKGGFIVFDDAWFPAIETVLSYVEANRPGYSITHLVIDNTLVLKRIGHDQRDWSEFKPFPVPVRSDWTPLPEQQRRRRRDHGVL
jgi:hypothetical protein